MFQAIQKQELTINIIMSIPKETQTQASLTEKYLSFFTSSNFNPN